MFTSAVYEIFVINIVVCSSFLLFFSLCFFYFYKANAREWRNPKTTNILFWYPNEHWICMHIISMLSSDEKKDRTNKMLSNEVIFLLFFCVLTAKLKQNSKSKKKYSIQILIEELERGKEKLFQFVICVWFFVIFISKQIFTPKKVFFFWHLKYKTKKREKIHT